MNMEKTKVMIISRATICNTDYNRSKQLENVEYFNYLGSMITNDARCARKIKSRIAMAEAAFNKEKAVCTSKLDLKLREKASKVLHLEHCFVWCCNLDNSESRSETPGKF
jgi:urease gamma subunit